MQPILNNDTDCRTRTRTMGRDRYDAALCPCPFLSSPRLSGKYPSTCRTASPDSSQYRFVIRGHLVCGPPSDTAKPHYGARQARVWRFCRHRMPGIRFRPGFPFDRIVRIFALLRRLPRISVGATLPWRGFMRRIRIQNQRHSAAGVQDTPAWYRSYGNRTGRYRQSDSRYSPGLFCRRPA